MLTEMILHMCGWDSVWYAHPGPGIRGALRGVRWGGRFLVGTWTGEQGDLLCIRPCSTNAEAERCLAPGGRTLLTAALASLWKLATTRHR